MEIKESILEHNSKAKQPDVIYACIFPWIEFVIIFDLLRQFNRTRMPTVHFIETIHQTLASSDLTIPNTSVSEMAGAANWEHAPAWR